MIHHVYANRSNIGDWLSARGIQSCLAPWPITEHLCDEPFVPETLAALHQATAEDLIVIGGGGLFMDYFTPFWHGLRTIAERVPVAIWGVGYCDLKQEPSLAPRDRLVEVIEHSRLCVVRDELTRTYLALPSLPHPALCPSVLLIHPPDERGHDVLHVDNYTTAGAAVYEAMGAHARTFARRTHRPYRKTNNRIEAGSERELAATLRRYERSDIVVSSALHGCIIAVAMGRKVIAVSGDRKIEAFMEAVGLREWVLNLDQVDDLPARLEALPMQPHRLAEMERARNANQEIATTVAMLLSPATELASL